MQLTKELIAAGFELPKVQKFKRLVIASHGLSSPMTPAGEKTGKSRWSMLAKQPVFVVGTDPGTEPIARMLQAKKREIYLKQIDIPRLPASTSEKDRIAAHEPVWDAAKGAIIAAIEDHNVKTLVIDKGDQLWDVLRLVRFGKLSQVMPEQYEPVNTEFRNLVLRCCERDDLTSIWVHSSKKQYVKDKGAKRGDWNGQWERDGFGEMGALVDINLVHYYYRRENQETGDTDKGFGVKVLNSRYEMAELEGLELEGDMCTFQMLAEMAYPGTDGEWD